MSKAEIDAWFDQIRIRLRKKQKNPPTSEIQANDIFFVNQPTTLDDKAVDTQVVKGPSYLYNVAMFAYRDSDTPPNKWRVTEYCSFTNNAGVQTLCDQHNRISLQD